MNQNQIRARLTAIGKSQSWLAVETGLAQSYINHLTSSRVPNPTIRTAGRVAKALNCRIEDLWSINGQPKEIKEDYI